MDIAGWEVLLSFLFSRRHDPVVVLAFASGLDAPVSKALTFEGLSRLAGILGFVGTVFAFVVVERRGNRALLQSIFAGLDDLDQCNIDHPEIQEFLCRTRQKEPRDFRFQSVDSQYIVAKTYVYRQLNLFDQILAFAVAPRRPAWLWRGWSWLCFPHRPELADWEHFLAEQMRHPLYRYIMDAEGKIFGVCLRDFYESSVKSLRGVPVAHSW